MKTGLNILTELKVQGNNSSWILPSTYIDFANTFELGEGCLKNEILRRDDIDFDIPLTNVIFKKSEYELGLEYLYSIAQIHQSLDQGEKSGNPFIDHKLVRIAHLVSPSNQQIYLGYGEENLDKIFVGPYFSSDHEEYTCVCQNILEFVGQLQTITNQHQINDRTSKLLYRNWGEYFWRLRND